MLGQHRPAVLTKGCGRGCRDRRNCESRGTVGSKSGRGAGSSWKGMGCPKMPWGCCGNFPERGDQDLSINILFLARRNNSKQSDNNIPHLHNILPGWQIFVVHSLIKSNICSLSAVCIQRMYLETVKSTTESFWKYWHFPQGTWMRESGALLVDWTMDVSVNGRADASAELRTAQEVDEWEQVKFKMDPVRSGSDVLKKWV